MIELSPTAALMIYFGITLAILMSIWFYHHYTSRHKKILPSEKDLHVCEFCHFAYLETGAKKITRCPRCQSYNSSSV